MKLTIKTFLIILLVVHIVFSTIAYILNSEEITGTTLKAMFAFAILIVVVIMAFIANNRIAEKQKK